MFALRIRSSEKSISLSRFSLALAAGIVLAIPPTHRHAAADDLDRTTTKPTTTQPTTTRDLIQQGRRLETTNAVAAADRFVLATTRDDVPASLIKPLRLRAVGLYLAEDQLDPASATLVKLSRDAPDEEIAQMTLAVASKWLAKSDFPAAKQLFELALASGFGQQDAQLGLLWIECQSNPNPWAACQKLLDFAMENPGHPAARRSKQLATDRLAQTLVEFLKSDQTLDQSFHRAFDLWRQTSDNANSLTTWLHAIEPSRAQEVARIVFEKQPIHTVDRCSRAAARWAGRSEHWMLLSELSEMATVDQMLPASPTEGQTDLARLIAEALVQTGRPAQSLPWWRRLVETPSGQTFAVQLRLAEVEIAIGSDLTAAKKSVDAARVLVDRADPDAAEKYLLVDMVQANLSIRKADFENARYLLEQIVRRPHRCAAVAGNAQWLIGETFSMQGKYADAIEAYRKVDGIDPSNANNAAALLQAGRCFEQLGRTRQASMCYDHLLSRFGESQHAIEASQRLASLGTIIR